jgi:hypothetical protein
MNHSQLTDHVRKVVAQTFAEMGLAAEPLRESILLHEGHYCGRRFDAPGAHAVWFIEEQQIKVIAADGRLACVLSTLSDMQNRPRLAA